MPSVAEAELTPAEAAPALRAGGDARVLSGAWTLPMLAGRWRALEAELQAAAAVPAAWDLRAVTAIDGLGAVLLWRAWGRKRPPSLALQPEHEAVFATLARTPAAPPRRAPKVHKHRLQAVAGHALDATALLGQLLLDGLGWLARPDRIAWREISANVFRAGAQALPITALVGFLVGVTLSYLTSRQLKAFGADIYIVDILGIGVLREIGPLLAALLIAGRSGSSMTAQLGVMRVTQELDALAVMGIPASARLVLPKVLALAAAMPLVTLWTGFMMLLGGTMAAQMQLGLDPSVFVRQLPRVVPAANLALGLGKSVAFGGVVALVACHFGLRVKPDTESLGAGTTASVVSSITAVIVLDAIAAVVFADVGLG